MVRSLRYLKGKNCTGANQRSQAAKATRQRTPITIMTIMLALAQPFPVLAARLKGRRRRDQPAVMRTMPRTRGGRNRLAIGHV